ncbi:MAG: sulfatase-like hydrolase/transferase [Planctomycetes bacterium]|nr:sulfatase-like hydrolase/transferase [Planctomycetota bacterium]
MLSFLNDKGAIVWPLPKGPEPPEGSRLARGWRSLVQGSERVSWHAAAVVWAFFVGSWGALMVYRAFMRSSLARLLESKDVPFLAYMDDWFWAYAWGCVTLGGLATALAGGHWWDERGSRRRQVMFGGSLLATLVAGWTLRYSTSAEGALSVSNTGLSDWVLLALFGIVCWVGSACRAEEGRRELLPRSPSPAGQAWAYDAPLFYCLSVVAIAALAIDEHRILWDYARNGKFNYVRFFAEGELALANQVLYSTSLLFASLAAGLALLFQLAFRLAGSRGAEDRWPALRRRCLLASLGLSVVAMVPWMVKVGREIVGEGNYFFPVGVVGCLWACLFPLLAATAALLERDLDEDCVGLSRWGEAGRLLFVTLTFPVYPFLRLVRFRTLRSWTCVLYGFTALALLVMLVRLGYTMNAWWEFEDWRGMMKSGQFPATRVAVSLFAAGAVFVALGGVRRRLGKWLGLPFLVLGFGLLAFASWPLWGWSEIPRNVHTRCVEFSSRHKFERRFLTWLLDFDRDGYAALLAGGDPDDFDPEIQGTGLPPLREVAMPLDTFRIETPAQAARFPSVVLLTLEGVTPASITAYGLRPGLGGKVATPAMDALAREGALFTRAYAAYPSTWDGWFMLHSGRTLSVQEFDSSQPFGDRYTRYGNLHHLMREVGIRRFCYPDTRPYTDLFVPARDEDLLFEPEFSASRTKEERKAGVTKGDKRIDRVVRFIESIGEGERFFVTEHMGDTHFPWADVTAARAKELGYPKGMSWVAMDASVDGVSVPRLGRYYQQITRMDTQVGRVVEALRAKGVLDQTLIVIVSDHGCQWYEHEHAYYVSHLYEQSLRIPWIVRGPGVEAGIVSDLPIAQIDLLPTLVEMSGARLEQPERPLEGQSLLPIWKGSPEDDAFRDRYWKRTLLLKTHYDTVGVLVNFRHKLIVDRPTGIRWLFDLEADPGELINLIDREPELEARLEQVLRAEVETRMPFLGGLKRSGER